MIPQTPGRHRSAQPQHPMTCAERCFEGNELRGSSPMPLEAKEEERLQSVKNQEDPTG